ncbi:MAG: hypothetical protein R2710_24180 [Acidimicrobiales bacterium]
MLVISPHSLATLMPPPSGMLRSQTTRSGWCCLMASMASVALPASAITMKFGPRSARTPLRQIG